VNQAKSAGRTRPALDRHLQGVPHRSLTT
jgi:hypothetical protein